MDQRDFFAGCSLIALLLGNPHLTRDKTSRQIAKLAFDLGDSMLDESFRLSEFMENREREKQNT